MSGAESILEHGPSDELPGSPDLKSIPPSSGCASKIVRSIEDFLMIISAFDQREEVFDSTYLVIGIQWFSHLREYGWRSSHELGESRETIAIPVPRWVVHQGLSQLLNSGITGLTFLSESLKEVSHSQAFRRRWWRWNIVLLLVVISSLSFPSGSLLLS